MSDIKIDGQVVEFITFSDGCENEIHGSHKRAIEKLFVLNTEKSEKS